MIACLGHSFMIHWWLSIFLPPLSSWLCPGYLQCLTRFSRMVRLAGRFLPVAVCGRVTPCRLIILTSALTSCPFSSLAQWNKNIHGFKLLHSGPAITHLCFADDILLFGRATCQEVSSIMTILNNFFSNAALSLSIQESKLFISKNTPRDTRNAISTLTGFHVTIDLGRYLGLPLLHRRLSSFLPSPFF